MDWETPADAWYVWVAVTLLSLAMAGLVLGLPSEPPPDADRAANAIDETAGSSAEAATTYEHDADAVRTDGKTIELKHEHGTDRSSLNYGQVAVVNGDDRLETLVRTGNYEAAFARELDDPTQDAVTALVNRTATADGRNADRWIEASDELAVRQVVVEPNAIVEPEITASMEAEWWARQELFADSFDLLEYLELTHRSPYAEAVTYTIEGESAIDAAEGTDRFWEQAETEIDDWEGADDCWFERCSGDDPTELLNPRRTAQLEITHTEPFDTRQIDLDQHVEDGPGEDVWIGDDPITVTAETDHYRCEGTIPADSRSVDLCRGHETGTAADTLVDDLGWVELNGETERYHVTLVVV